MDLGSFYSVPNLFTSEECDRIVREYSKKCVSSETVKSGNARSSKNHFIEYSNETDWIYMRLGSLVEYFNNEKFKFNLYNRFQNIQFTKYEDGDYYKWHVDVGPSSDTCIRKISLTIQLSDDTSYSGGDLQFGHSDKETLTASREKGSVTLFPSIIRHQVTPVTNGTRYSLVVWATGAPFQ
jgi:PKHD-type hydroxylase